MRIIHIHHNYFPVVGGIEVTMNRLGLWQTKFGNEVYVLTGNINDGFKGDGILRVHRVPIIHIPNYREISIPINVPNELLKNADIIQGYNQNSLFTYIIERKAYEYGKPIITYLIAVDYLHNHYRLLMRTLGFKYQVYLTRRFIKLSRLLFVTNNYERELLMSRYGVDSAVIPHGIDDEYLEEPSRAWAFRNKYGITDEIFTYIGRLHWTKGIDMLIKAFKYVINKFDNIRLVLAGKGDRKYISYLSKLIDKLRLNGLVLMLGYINEDDKIALIDASRAVILPSRHAGESYPLIANETAARLKPLIATGIGSIPRLSMEHIVITELNETSIAEAMIKMLNSEYYKDYVDKAKKVRERLLRWSDVAKLTIKYYNEVIK
ncbi:glycosyltransferase family 4 protein [Vulcanisaeta distributa]|uniref:Glycosyl transferase group 1 n=1 Tax=Vulcanisaeta distributa (strain DSM 14429 / JCM 11212 / NBRC 100878 / IC-017) TaxID=572478 RepID=E1QUE6_VULDI|nr:glycosyltransferase family 4 protein [Vulcanisaeta distributa]ADN49872.1 glycosyl transferase group 1 [Vulcanisaeta distributa DSM 14429]